MNYTSNYNFKKPENSDYYNIGDVNDNMDAIDSALNSIESQDIVSSGTSGIYGLRYNNDKLQIKNSSNQWVNLFNILDAYPIGSIYISVVNTNPGTIFGGTWIAFAEGRTIVGVHTTETEFATVEKTGGSKKLHKHSHTFTGTSSSTGTASESHYHRISKTAILQTVENNMSARIYYHKDANINTNGTSYRPGTKGSNDDSRTDSIDLNASSTNEFLETTTSGAAHTHSFTPSGTISEEGTGGSGNIQPYITVYMFKRTA